MGLVEAGPLVVVIFDSSSLRFNQLGQHSYKWLCCNVGDIGSTERGDRGGAIPPLPIAALETVLYHWRPHALSPSRWQEFRTTHLERTSQPWHVQRCVRDHALQDQGVGVALQVIPIPIGPWGVALEWRRQVVTGFTD